MLNNLLQAKNLTKLTNEIDDYYKNGIYVFLKPSETYDVIDDYFISNCVAVVNKGENDNVLLDNVLLDDEVKNVSFNGYALNANKQYNKMFSVSPYLITQTNINKMSTTKKEDVIKFFDDTFCEQFLNKNIEDVFKFYKNGKQDKEYSKEVQDLIKNQSKDTIDEMIESAKVTKEFVDNNYDFIQKVNDYFIEKTNENKSYALLRVNFIITDDVEKIKDHMDFYLKIRTYANRRSAVSPIIDGKGYMYTFMSAMYNQKKPFVGLNRSDFELNGNEMISIDDLDLHVNLFKYVKFVSESTRFKNANIFIKDDEIKKFGDNGSTVYTFKNVKSSYYLIDVRTITAYKKNAQRDFNFEYEVVSYKKEDKKTVIIDSYVELAKHIFYGSKDKGVSNQLFVDLKGKDNNRIRNKFYEGNELRDESKKIMSKLESVSNFEEDESIVLPILKDISNLLFSNSNFDGDTVYSAKIKYRNMLNFWGGLLEKFGGDPIDKKEIDLKQPIENEENYIATLSKGIVYIYDYVNKQKSQPFYTSRHFSELVNTLDVKKLERMFKINYSKNSYLLLDNDEVYGRMLLSSILSNDLKVKGSLKKYRTSIINEVSL